MTDSSVKVLDKNIVYDLMQTDFGNDFMEKYELKYLLCHSYTSYVYVVSEKITDKLYILKVISRRKYDVDIEVIEQIKHPGIVEVIDVATTDIYIYIVKEYIEGLTLERYIEENGYMQEEQVIDIAKELCGILGYLHTLDSPVIFRDLKPANIMMTTDGKIKLIDIDSLRRYKEDSKKDTVFIGTEGYAAPEQFGFSQTDARTDIYTLGTTMYFLLAGQPPAINNFKLRDIREIRLDLSGDTYRIIEKCTMFSPQNRYQSIEQLHSELQGLDKEKQIINKRGIFRLFNRNRSMKAIVATATITIFIGGYFIIFNWDTFAENKHISESSKGYRMFYNLGQATEVDLSDMSRMSMQYPAQTDKSLNPTDVQSSYDGKSVKHLDYILESPNIESLEDKTIKIAYPSNAVSCEYSYNYISWHEYNGPVEVIREGYIYIRSRMPDGSYIYNNIFIDSLDPIEHHRHQIVHRIYPGFEVPSDKRKLTIYYPKGSVIQEYSFDSVSWIPYEDALCIEENCYVFYRAIMPNGKLIKGGVNLSSFDKGLKSGS